MHCFLVFLDSIFAETVYVLCSLHHLSQDNPDVPFDFHNPILLVNNSFNFPIIPNQTLLLTLK